MMTILNVRRCWRETSRKYRRVVWTSVCLSDWIANIVTSLHSYTQTHAHSWPAVSLACLASLISCLLLTLVRYIVYKVLWKSSDILKMYARTMQNEVSTGQDLTKVEAQRGQTDTDRRITKPQCSVFSRPPMVGELVMCRGNWSGSLGVRPPVMRTGQGVWGT